MRAIGWYLVQTTSNGEQLAESSLRSDYRAFRVFAPKLLVERFHARRREWVDRPFLPRYIFVMNDERGTSLIRSSPGVSHIVRNADGPICIRSDVIAQIKARQYRHANGKYYVAVERQVPSAFVLGQKVRVQTAGTVINGLFQEMRGTDRASILLNGLGMLTVSLRKVESH